MKSGLHLLEQVALFLIVAAVCLSQLRDVLPHIAPAAVALGLVVIAVRLVFFHTRRW